MLPRASVSPHARRAFSQSIVFRDNAKKPEQQTKNAAGKPQKAPGRKIPSPMSAIAKTIKEYASKTTDQYVTYGVTEKLFATCSAQAEYTIPQASRGEEAMKLPSGEDLGVGTGWWYEELGLAPTFSTWSQVTFLHMYLLTVRLRAMPSHDSFLNYSRHLFDHFSHDAERRMDVLHQITL
ncbi:Protein cbp3, mitochondrial, partial [Ascosphaera atra]